MKKNLSLLFVYTVTLVTCVICYLLFGYSYVYADDILDGFCPELSGGTSGNNMSSGEYFKCQPLGSNEFKICKNAGCGNYEQFKYDNNYIYHVYDVPWSGDYGDEKCTDTGEIVIGVRFDPGVDPYSGSRGMKWIRLGMPVGENFNQPDSGTVIGQTNSGRICQTPHSGTIDHAMQFAYRGCIEFPTGVVSLDTLEFHITGGGGTGEQFFYNLSKKKGWVGFNRGTPDSGAYVTDPIDTLPPGTVCKEVGISAGGGTPFIGSPTYSCDLTNSGDQTSRPVECQDCNQTPKMVSSCATDFKVFDKVSFEKGEGDFCNDQYWVEKSWGGTVSLDLNSTNIPFVGKKNEENEQYYLADYFEGTYPYYTTNQTPYNLMSAEDQRRAFMQGGVWSKLATRDMQDTMKINMIKRAIASKNGTITEGVIRDYNVIYNGVTKQLSLFDGHFPPADEVERSDWEKNDEFGKMWFMVPMFTREDTKGSVVPYLGSMQKDQFTIQDADKSTVEKVPHVARLYEVSHAINQLLLPAARQNLTADSGNQNNLAKNTGQSNTNSKLLASADTLPPSNAVLLAQGGYNCSSPYSVAIENANFDGSQINYGVRISLNSGDGCQGHLYINGRFLGIAICPPDGYFESTDPNTGLSSIPASNNGTFGINVGTTIDIHKPCGVVSVSQSCTVTIVGGVITSSSCGSSPPPGPVCGSFTARNISQCQKIADAGPGDTICCGTINATLNATDRVENTQYTGCNPAAYPLGGDPCHYSVDVDVQRSLGVALSHPYLEKIWEDTTNSTSGFINLWRLADAPVFAPTDAKSSINYSYSSNNKNPNIEPGTGDFYYPYLGGIFNAKNWLVNTLLTKDQQEQQTTP